MRGVESQIEENGVPARVLLHERYSFTTENVCDVLSAILLCALVVAEQRGDAVPFVCVVIDAVVAVPVEAVEPALERQEAFGLPHIPLADDCR